MTEKHIFADVEKPFHVWVKEGARWVLRDAGTDLHIEGCAPLGTNGTRSGTNLHPSKAA